MVDKRPCCKQCSKRLLIMRHPSTMMGLSEFVTSFWNWKTRSILSAVVKILTFSVDHAPLVSSTKQFREPLCVPGMNTKFCPFVPLGLFFSHVKITFHSSLNGVLSMWSMLSWAITEIGSASFPRASTALIGPPTRYEIRAIKIGWRNASWRNWVKGLRGGERMLGNCEIFLRDNFQL